MQALVVTDDGLRYRADWPEPVLRPGEALIRLSLAGICSTDIEIVKGYSPLRGVLGHEFVGVVTAVADPAERHWLNRRVVGEINLGCRQCAVCLSDGPHHCPQRTVLGIINRDGAFADYLTLPVVNLHPVPDHLPDETAVFTEPAAAALRILEQTNISPTDRLAVIGPGRVGLLIGQVLSQTGAATTLLGRSAAALELPVRLGLTTGLVDEAADNSFDLVVEATGNAAGLAHALRLVRPLGRLVMKSTYADREPVDLTKLVVGEIQVIGSRCGPFHTALEWLADGRIQTEPLIDGRYPLRDGLTAFAHAQRPGVRKILLTTNDK
jgi:threonine dehydrogenase-like Zn-dependent dehydrogenase